MAMLLVPMREADALVREINGFDLAVKERHPSQQPADRADDIGDVEITRRDFVQHRSEEEKVVLVDEGDVQVGSARQRAFEFQGGIHPAESTTQNHHAWLSVHHTSSATAKTFWRA